MLEKEHVGAIGAEWALGAADRIVLAGRVIVFYFTKLLWPTPLLFFYPRWEVSAASAWQWLFPAAVAAALAVLWAARDTLGRGPLAATLIFIGMLFPALGFFDVFPFQYSFVADHFQYHASAAALAGLAAVATLAVSRLSDARLRAIPPAAWLAVLACITAAQTRVYVGVEPLYRHVLAHDPSSFIAANNLGTFYSRHNRLDEAKLMIQVAVTNARFDRQKSLALWNLCDLALRIQDNQLLLDGAREAYRLVPSLASRAMLGLALVRNGESDAADELLKDIETEEPDSRVGIRNTADAHRLALAEIAAVRQDPAAAKKQLDLLLGATNNQWMRLQAGILFARVGQSQEAVQVFGMLRDHPVYGGCAFSNLGIIALERGNTEVAETCFRTAVNMDASLLEPHVWLARIYGRQKRFAEAEASLVEAVRRAPDDEALAASLQTIRVERAAATAAGEP
jgi:tetratricopeptide (TPR) repeat protein